MQEALVKITKSFIQTSEDRSKSKFFLISRKLDEIQENNLKIRASVSHNIFIFEENVFIRFLIFVPLSLL